MNDSRVPCSLPQGGIADGQVGRGYLVGALTAAVVVLVALLLAVPAPAAGGWMVERITTNTWNDSNPDLDSEGRYVVFQGKDGIGDDDEIFLYDLESGIQSQLTDNDSYDFLPQVDAGHVVWMGNDGHDSEIFLHDIAAGRTRRLTDNATGEGNPRVCGNLVVWEARMGADSDSLEIFAYSISAGRTTRLTENSYTDQLPETDGSWVVWQGEKGKNWEIFVWDGAVKTMLTVNDRDDVWPTISNHCITWMGYDGADFEVFLRRGAVTEQLTHNMVDEWWPQIYATAGGTWLAWSAGEVDARDVYLAGPRPGAGTSLTITRLTKDELWDDHYVRLGPGGLVWAKRLPPYLEHSVYHSTLGGAVSQIAGSWTEPPCIGGPYVAFAGTPEGVSKREIYVATRDTMAPVVGIKSPADGEVLTERRTTIRGTATDDLAVEFVEVDTGDGVWQTAVIEDGKGTGSATWRFDWSLPLEDGVAHTLRARVTDAAGNTALSTTEPTVRVDNVVEKRTFRDVPVSHPYFTAIAGMQQEEIIAGYEVDEGWEFRPDGDLLRAQFAKMICGAAELTVTEDLGSPFSDLGQDDPADLYPHQYVAAAYDYGVTRGTSATNFSPWSQIRRAQVVTMVVRAADALDKGVLDDPPAGYSGTLGLFDSTHGPTMQAAEYNDLLEGLVGFGPGWDPWASMTRGETAQMLWNLMGKAGTRS